LAGKKSSQILNLVGGSRPSRASSDVVVVKVQGWRRDLGEGNAGVRDGQKLRWRNEGTALEEAFGKPGTYARGARPATKASVRLTGRKKGEEGREEYLPRRVVACWRWDCQDDHKNLDSSVLSERRQ